MSDFFHRLPECCDAEHYLSLGAQCTVFQTCHGPLRPAGAYYWFSIPYQLGVSTEILVILGLGMVLVSALLSWVVLGRLLALEQPSGPTHRRTLKTVLLVAAVGIHGIFFAPTVFHSVSEPPAVSLFLSGVWLFLWAAHLKTGRTKKYLLVLGALCWGLSAWVRAFFLYPVLAGFVIVACALVWRRQAWHALLVVAIGLLPIASQYLTMYRAYGTFGYLDNATASKQSEAHLSLPIVGFDTYLPHHAYAWDPQTCQARYSVWNGMQEGAWGDVMCVTFNRLYFYLGTYRWLTYDYVEQAKMLTPGSSENVGSTLYDWQTEMEFFPDVALAPSGNQSADKLLVKATDRTRDARQKIPLEEGKTYTFSVWLWSPLPKSVLVGLTYGDYTHRAVAVQQLELSPEPVRVSVTGVIPETAQYHVSVGDIPTAGVPVSFGQSEGDYLYAWGAQMEEGDQATAYQANAPVDPQKIRQWSPGLFAINGLALLLALGFVVRNRRLFGAEGSGAATLVAITLSAAQALGIIPEQRFFIPVMVIAWLWAVTLLLQLSGRFLTRQASMHPLTPA